MLNYIYLKNVLNAYYMTGTMLEQGIYHGEQDIRGFYSNGELYKSGWDNCSNKTTQTPSSQSLSTIKSTLFRHLISCSRSGSQAPSIVSYVHRALSGQPTDWKERARRLHGWFLWPSLEVAYITLPTLH